MLVLTDRITHRLIWLNTIMNVQNVYLYFVSKLCIKPKRHKTLYSNQTRTTSSTNIAESVRVELMPKNIWRKKSEYHTTNSIVKKEKKYSTKQETKLATAIANSK